MCQIVDNICNDLRSAIDDGSYAPGLLSQLTRGVFPSAQIRGIEGPLTEILTCAARLQLGKASGGYPEDCCDVGALGGEVVKMYDRAMEEVQRDLNLLPRLAAA